MVEDTIMNTCQGIGVGHGVEGEGLVSGAVLETFWDMATAEMLSVLRTNCVSVSSAMKCLLLLLALLVVLMLVNTHIQKMLLVFIILCPAINFLCLCKYENVKLNKKYM